MVRGELNQGAILYPQKTQNSAFCCDALRFCNAEKCRVWNAGGKRTAFGCRKRRNATQSEKIAPWSPTHNTTVQCPCKVSLPRLDAIRDPGSWSRFSRQFAKETKTFTFSLKSQTEFILMPNTMILNWNAKRPWRSRLNDLEGQHKWPWPSTQTLHTKKGFFSGPKTRNPKISHWMLHTFQASPT